MDQENLPAPRRPENALEPVNGRFTLADAGFDDEPSGGGLRRIIGALLYYKWMILAITIVGSAAGFLASRYAEKEFTAEARLWVEVPTRETDMQGPIQSAELLEGTAWLELLYSFAVLDHVVREERLYLEFRESDRDVMQAFSTDSVFAPGLYSAQADGAGRDVTLRRHDGEVVETVPAGGAIGTELGFNWAPPASVWRGGRQVDFNVIHPRTAAFLLSEQLRGEIARGSNFLMLRYSGRNAEQVAEVMNSVADRYVAVAAELKRSKLSELRDILDTQLVYAEQNLRRAELELESFRVQTITLPSDEATPVNPGIEATRDPALSGYFDMSIQRESLERDRQAIQRLLAGAGGGPLSVDALSAIEAVQRSPELTQALTELTVARAELRALSQQYTEEHPLVRRAAADVQELQGSVVPDLARGVVASLDSRVDAMDQLVTSAAAELREIPPRAIDEARLNRAVTIAATLYNELRQRYESARLATETTIPDVRVLDHATVPQYPSSNPSMQILLLAIVASLGMGVGLALLLERLDPRIRYPEQVSDGMRLRILGGIPDLSSRRWRFGTPDRAEAVEALRGVRLSLATAYGSAGPMMVTVSSPGSGDGKTFLTANLGIAFADLGRRTLLIDGDTRRGTLHRLMSVSRTDGLTDYLDGRVDIDAIIRETQYPNLDVIPCGARLAHSPELLSSPRMGELSSEIRSRYDVILVDSPPLGAGIDPLVLATLTGHIVLVMRTGKTDRAMAEAKLSMLDQLPVRLLGAIVNGIQTHDGYRYYSYLPGYEAEEEEAGTGRRMLEPA